MDFSVLMSVYYKEDPARLDRALYSNLTGQSRKPTQLVLICDGPLNDALDAVIDDYQKQYPSIMAIHRLSENVGLGRALKNGVELCEHELIARSDSDDVCAPDRFEKQLAYMEQHPEISVLGGAIDEFETDPAHPSGTKHMPLTHKELCQYARKRNPLNHMAVMFRKSDVVAVGSYRHLQFMEDYYLWVRMLAAGKKLANLEDILVHACVGNGMLDRRGDKRYIQSWKMLGRYMLEQGLQTRGGHMINMLKLRVWCYMPKSLRRYAYKTILRK